MDTDGRSYMIAMSPTMRADRLPFSQQNSPWVTVGSTKTQENIIHKKSFSKAAASLFAVTLLVAPSVYADQSAIGFDNLTAAKATADFCAGKYTSEALVTAALSRAKALAEHNAFITLDDNGALAAAKQADAARKSGARCRPLEGVPIVVKDNI